MLLRLLVGKLTWVVSQIDNSLGSRLGKVSDFCRVEQLFELVHVIVVFFLRHVQIHVEAKLVDVFLPRLEGGASPLGHWIDVARLVLILVMVLVLVVEAATENLALKLRIFGDMDTHAPEHAILATNTSSISITQIAAVTNRPDKVIGMHFMNPVPVMKLVEIIRGYATSDEVTKTIMDASKSLKKK